MRITAFAHLRSHRTPRRKVRCTGAQASGHALLTLDLRDLATDEEAAIEMSAAEAEEVIAKLRAAVDLLRERARRDLPTLAPPASARDAREECS